MRLCLEQVTVRHMSEIRKFLVIADGSDESQTAAYFAARRAHKSGGQVSLLSIIEPSDFEHWIGVGETMRREATEGAEATLESLAEEVEAVMGQRPDILLKEGDLLKVLRQIIQDDDDVALLVIGAGPSEDPPGPLIAALGRGKGLFSDRAIPVTVVPGDLTRQQIDNLS